MVEKCEYDGDLVTEYSRRLSR